MSQTGPTRTDEPAVAPAGSGSNAPSSGGAPDDARRRRLASYSMRNMVWSMLLVTLVVLAWWSLSSSPGPDEQQRRAPEVVQTATYVADQAPWPVWVPDPGEGWTPTVVWYDARVDGVTTWHISYTSPAGEYVALHQAADVTEEWVRQVLPESSPTGEQVRLPGPTGPQEWQEWEGPEDGNAEVGYLLGSQHTDGSTVAVHGTADLEEIEAFLQAVTARD